MAREAERFHRNDRRDTIGRINRWIEATIFIWVLAALVVGVLFSDRLRVWQVLVAPLFGWMTFVTTTGSRRDQLIQVFRRPGPVLLTLGMAHVLLPLTLGLGIRFAGLSKGLEVGVILATAVPMAVTSIMWIGLAGGNAALALAVVSVDTLMTPITIPATFQAFGVRGESVSFGGLFWMLVGMVFVPAVLGFCYQLPQRPGWAAVRARVANPLRLSAKAAMLAVVSINMARVAPLMVGDPIQTTVKVLGILVVLSLGGYGVGYFLPKLLRFPANDRIAMAFLVGMRNISAGASIAVLAFGRQVAVPVVLVTVFQQPLATGIFWLWRYRNGD